MGGFPSLAVVISGTVGINFDLCLGPLLYSPKTDTDTVYSLMLTLPSHAVVHAGFEQATYTFSESDGFQEVCVREFNPPPGENHIFLAYNTTAGTASGQHKLQLHMLVFMTAIRILTCR